MILQSPSLDITMSIGDREENESVSSFNGLNALTSLCEINLEQADTMDYSNCATSPSKVTYVSSIPGTIYYNGLDSVTQPHIENARVVTSESQFFSENETSHQKIRPPRNQGNSSVSSSVPRMQWTPPLPLSGNDQQTEPSRPKYTAKTYESSAMQDNIVPAIPIEDVPVNSFADTIMRRRAMRICCGKIKAYKALLILTAIVIVLAISAVIFSFVYVSGSTKEDEIGRQCRPDCYDPSLPSLVCKCDCYTKKDEKFYTCRSNQTKPNDYNFDDNYDFDGDDDGSSEHDDNLYDDSVQDHDCVGMCYRKNIHRDWNPMKCHPACYSSHAQYTIRHKLWMQWFIPDDLNHETKPLNTPPDSAAPTFQPQVISQLSSP